ncbi:adenylate kinase 7-like isoform X2 [Eleginops maclovinus]|uniref:adenylate kinase 7-like isoform X2 n=1 Tax=Eleginops maclovinus TaxID=56733 RepID=UPI003080B65D
MGDKKQQKRVFINDVDKYSSRHIAKFLSTCVTEEDSEEAEAEETSPLSEHVFQIVGTSSTKDNKETSLLEHYTSPTREDLLKHLLECDVVVYNVSESTTEEQVEDATWAITALHAEIGNFKSRKLFILVSSVMTWAMTKPQNQEETNVLLTEEEFRRRRPHPHFKTLHDLEKLVLVLGRGKKSKLTGYVVACGLQYGKGENLFHYFFKVSWLMQMPKVPLFGQGTNHIPMIHVYDLGGVIQNIIELRPKSKYILAVDDSKNTLEDIVKMISDTLGPEKIELLSDQDAITMKAFKPEELEYLNINLRLDAFVIKDSFSLHWTSEAGMVENMASIVEEYQNIRKLLPIRICVVGPPAVGKTTVSEKLCSHYQIHHIRIKEVIEEKIALLKEIVKGADSEYVGEDVAAAAAQKQLETFNKSMDMNAGRLADHLVFDILQEKLKSKPCRNQGFVLDGFPKTYEQAKLIFSDEDPENQDLMITAPSYIKNITPEHVFALDATDDFLNKRARALPQSVAEEMRYTEEEFSSRLTRYRELSTAEETLLDYFDELEIHPEHIEVTTDDPEYADVMKKITELVGVPKNYGLQREEQEEEARKKEEERKQKAAAEAAESKRSNEAALAEMAAQYDEWNHLCEVQRQENQLHDAHSLPLRNYLMKYVMTSLTEAMKECSRIKPEDPVDFLAELLLRNNQQE